MSKVKRIFRILLWMIALAALIVGTIGTFASAAGSDVRGMISVGERYLSEENYDAAIELFSKVIEVEPEYAPAYVDRGNTYAAMNDTDKATEDYNTAIELDPEQAEVLQPTIDQWEQAKEEEKKAEQEKQKEDMKLSLAKLTSKTIQEVYYGDYDSDGEYEAFAIAGVKDNTGGASDRDFYTNADILFANADGAEMIQRNIYGYYIFGADDSKGGNITVGKYSFFVFELSANGSGSKSFVWGVKDKRPRVMNISGNVEMLTQDKDSGKVTGCNGNFSSGYHQYVYNKYVLDENSFTFIKSDVDHID